MKYTFVFEWPDGQEPTIGRADTWKEGKLCAVHFADVFDEMRNLRNLADLCEQWEDILPVRIIEALDRLKT